MTDLSLDYLNTGTIHLLHEQQAARPSVLKEASEFELQLLAYLILAIQVPMIKRKLD